MDDNLFRKRERTDSDYGYFKDEYSGYVESATRRTLEEKMWDITFNKGGENPLIYSKSLQSGGLIDGYQDNGSRNPIFVQWRSWNHIPVDMLSVRGPLSGPDLSSRGLDIAAGHALKISNPNRADFSVPNFLYELKDLPEMVRHAGRVLNLSREALARYKRLSKPGRFDDSRRLDMFFSKPNLGLAQELASTNLALRFGWQPLVSDLTKMVGLHNSVSRRRKEMNRLYSGKGLKRKVTLDSSSSAYAFNAVVYSQMGVYLNPAFRQESIVDQWAIIHYNTTDASPLPPGNFDLARMCTGLTAGSVTSAIWEALPWSWLVDYFSNVGDVVDKSNNELKLAYYGSLMTHIVDTITMGTDSRNGVSVSAGTAIRETKNRFPILQDTGTLPQVQIPLLSGDQLSILGSLAVTRARGGK